MTQSSYPDKPFVPANLSRQDWRLDSQLLEALYESWQSQYADYLGESEAELLMLRLKDSGDLLTHNDPFTLVASAGEQLVGVAALRPLKGLSMITMLEVIESYRGRGIGRQLVEGLTENDKRLLAHVSIHRPDTREFYVTLGFKALDRTVVDHYGHALEFDVMVR